MAGQSIPHSVKLAVRQSQQTITVRYPADISAFNLETESVFRIRFLSVAVVPLISSIAFADLPREKPHSSPFDTLLQRVATVAASRDWTKNDWSDAKLESSLSALISHVQIITKNKNIELPPTFDSVRAAISRDGSKIAHLDRGLFVTKRGRVSNAHNSIILADESIEVSHASDCLIVSRGAVDVGHGRRNVIIAGHFIHISHDGHPDPQKPGGSNGSVLISGSVVDVSHATDTIVCAPLAVKMAFATNVTLINSTNRYISHERKLTCLTDKSRTLPIVLPKHQCIEELKITRIVPPDDSGKGAFVATTEGNVETMIRIDDAIPNADAEQKGWKLIFVGNRFALFANDGHYAGAYIVPGD